MSQPDEINPYSVSSLSADPFVQEPRREIRLASQGQRFLTLIIDNIATYLLNMTLGFVIGFAYGVSKGGQITPDELANFQFAMFFVGLLSSFCYYCVLEKLTGRTIGKLITGTRVVSEDGNDASFGQIVGRSLCRFIPFEAFSFFGNAGHPIGWHDSIPKTRVIKTR